MAPKLLPVACSFIDSRHELSLDGYDEIFEVDEELYLLYQRGGDFQSADPDGAMDSPAALHVIISGDEEVLPLTASSDVAGHFAEGHMNGCSPCSSNADDLLEAVEADSWVLSMDGVSFDWRSSVDRERFMAYRRGFCDAMLQYDGQASDTEAALNDVLEEDELQIALEQLGQHLPMDAAEHDPQSRDFAVGAPVHHNAPAGESAAVTMSPAPGSSPTIAAQQLDGAATWTTSGPVGGPDARPEPISPSTVGPRFEAFADTLGARALIGATPMILGNDDYSGQLLDHLDSKSIQSEVGFPDMDTFAVTIFGEATRAGSPRRPRRSHRRSPDNDAVGGPEPIHFDVASDLEDMLELSPVPDEVGPFEMDEARWLNPAQPQVAGTTVPLQSWIGLPDFPCGAARGHVPDDLRAMSCSDPWAAGHGAMAPRPPAQPAPAMARPALGKPRHSSPQPSKTLAAHWQGRSPEFGRRSGDESLALSVSLQSWIDLPGFSCSAARDEAPPAVQPMPLAAAPARPTLGDRPIVAPVPSLRMPPQAPPLSD